MIDDLEQSQANGFVMEEPYRTRVTNYFPSFDTNHCQRTYELVKALPAKR